MLLIFFVLGILACDKSPSYKPELIYLDLTAVEELSGYRINLNADSIKERLYSGLPWSSVSDQEWCRSTPSEGPLGMTVITLKADPNWSDKTRSANIYFTAGQTVRRIAVNQLPTGKISVTPKSVPVSYKGATVEIEVESNVAWQPFVSVDYLSWISVAQPTRMAPEPAGTFKVTVAPNPSAESRRGQAAAIAVGGGVYSAVVYIAQDGAPQSSEN